MTNRKLYVILIVVKVVKLDKGAEKMKTRIDKDTGARFIMKNCGNNCVMLALKHSDGLYSAWFNPECKKNNFIYAMNVYAKDTALKIINNHC